MPIKNLSSKYFEGKPCRKCGSTRRYVNNKRCVSCRHRQGQKWYQTNSEKTCERVRKWQQSNPEKCYANSRKWHQENAETHRERKRKYYQENLEKCRQQSLNCRKANPKRYREINRIAKIKQRAKRAKAEGSYTTQEWINLKEKYNNRCLCCGRHQSELDRVLEQDHIIPLSKAGTNWISNIQPLCHDCNGMGGKGVKTIDYR